MKPYSQVIQGVVISTVVSDLRHLCYFSALTVKEKRELDESRERSFFRATAVLSHTLKGK